jgi:hypothetical protein
MPIDQFITRIKEMGIRLWLDQGQLRYQAPKNVLTNDLRAELAARKHAIIASLVHASQSTAQAFHPVFRDANTPSRSRSHSSGSGFWRSSKQTPASTTSPPLSACLVLSIPRPSPKPLPSSKLAMTSCVPPSHSPTASPFRSFTRPASLWTLSTSLPSPPPTRRPRFYSTRASMPAFALTWPPGPCGAPRCSA